MNIKILSIFTLLMLCQVLSHSNICRLIDKSNIVLENLTTPISIIPFYFRGRKEAYDQRGHLSTDPLSFDQGRRKRIEKNQEENSQQNISSRFQKEKEGIRRRTGRQVILFICSVYCIKYNNF